jgi:hypothetical protein
MPVHAFEVEDGSRMFWYRDNGCVAIHGRLYFVSDAFSQTCRVLERAAAEQGRARVHYCSIRGSRFPTLEYFTRFSFDTTIDPAWENFRSTTDGRPTGDATQERTWRRQRRLFINEIHPMFRKLQRWLRARAVGIRQERWLAVAMGSHPLVGGGSMLCQLPDDLVHFILLL